MKTRLTPIAPTFSELRIAGALRSHAREYQTDEAIPARLQTRKHRNRWSERGLSNQRRAPNPVRTQSAIAVSPRPADADGPHSPYTPTGPTNGDLQFGENVYFDTGVQASIAVHRSGMVLEFHKAQHNAGIWYHIGTVAGTRVIWERRQHSDTTGYRPAVAFSKEGYVIMVYSDRQDRRYSEQYYRVGQIDPAGGVNQSIQWLTDSIHWDRGYRTSIAINDQGVIVGVHEDNRSSYRLHYRVGHLRYPAGGDFTIHWDSGDWGTEYEYGMSPRIALNNHNQIVEVHQVTGKNLLQYRRGTVCEGKISFGNSRRYDDHASEPAVALLDSGLVVEIHSTLPGLYSRTGRFSHSNLDDIEWSAKNPIDDFNYIQSPVVSTNGIYAVETHSADYFETFNLDSSVVRISNSLQIGENSPT